MTWFVRATQGEDPPVLCWGEGQSDPSAIEMAANSIHSFLYNDLESGLLANLASARLGTRSFRRLRFEPEQCPRCGSTLAWRGVQQWIQGSTDTGRARMEADCPSCEGAFERWPDEPGSRLTDRT